MKLWTRFTIHFLAGWEWVDVGFILQQFHTFMWYLKLHKLWSDWKHNSVFWHIHTIQIHFTRSHEMQLLHTTFRGPLKCNSIQIITDASQSGHLCWISKCLSCHLQHDTQWQHHRWKYIQVAQSGWAKSVNQSLIYWLILFSQSINLNHTPSLKNPVLTVWSFWIKKPGHQRTEQLTPMSSA